MVRSERAFTDCRPVSMISARTIAGIGAAVGMPIDPRRFRANLYLDLDSAAEASEDAWVGRRVRIGDAVEVVIVGPDPRCKMITLDPDTSAPTPAIIQHVTAARDGMAGIYGAVVTEGVVRVGDAVRLDA